MAKQGKAADEATKFEYMDVMTVAEYEENFECDYDEYDRLCDVRRGEFEQFLGEFEADLVAAGLKDATIDKHYSNLDFYLNSYLLRIAPLDVRAGCYKIGDFLGNFFIRKCMWSTPETIKSNCASFKKFYKSMLDHGRISPDDYDFVCFIIKEDKQEWCDLCAEFNDPYSSNPFSPFGDDLWGALGSASIGDSGLLPDERAGIVGAAKEIIGMLESQGMTQEQMIGAIEDVMQALDRDEDLYDMADEDLMELLAGLGISAGKEALSELMCTSVSEPEVADKLCDDAKLDLDDYEYDELVTIVQILWERWLPDDPSDATFLAQVVEGYYLLDEGAREEALELWGVAWESLKRIVRVGGWDVLVSDEPVAIDRSVPEWAFDYEKLLEDEAARDPAVAEASQRFVDEYEALLSAAAKV